MRPVTDRCDADKLVGSVSEMYNVHLRVSPFGEENSDLEKAKLPIDRAGVSPIDIPAMRSSPAASTVAPSDSQSEAALHPPDPPCLLSESPPRMPAPVDLMRRGRRTSISTWADGDLRAKLYCLPTRPLRQITVVAETQPTHSCDKPNPARRAEIHQRLARTRSPRLFPAHVEAKPPRSAMNRRRGRPALRRAVRRTPSRQTPRISDQSQEAHGRRYPTPTRTHRSAHQTGVLFGRRYERAATVCRRIIGY